MTRESDLLDRVKRAPREPDHPRPVLKWRTAQELIETISREAPWVIPGYVARGTVTELASQIKTGKTTLSLAMVKAVLGDGEFLGEPAPIKGPVIYLTEENPTPFRAALARADINTKAMHILHRNENSGPAWSALAAEVITYATAMKAVLLVVDHISVWSGLTGDAENNAGEADKAMQPLKDAAMHGLAVLCIRHDRKSGGEIGQSGRGSSAFGGAADILMHLTKANTPGHETRRELTALGRLDDIPASVIIEYRDGEYVALGDSVKIERTEARQALLEVIPTGSDAAIRRDDIDDRVAELASRTFGKTTITRALDELLTEGLLKRRKHSRAFVWWQPPSDAPSDDQLSSPLSKDGKLILNGQADPEKLWGDDVDAAVRAARQEEH